MGKGMPQHMKAAKKEDHRYGSDWLVSGKRQYSDRQKGFNYKQHDPLGTQSTFDTAEKTGYKLGGALRQTRFHTGFQRRRATDIDPYAHRYKHDADIAARSREYAPVRREYLASQTWRNGKDPIAQPARGADANPRHMTGRHGDPFDPWYNTVHRTFGDAPGGFGEGKEHQFANTWSNMPKIGAFPGHLPQLDTNAYGGRHARHNVRLSTLDKEGLLATVKNCGVADAFTTYEVPFTSEDNMSAVKDHITKPH